MTKTVVDFASLNSELETILIELNREDLDVDQAIKHYERGLKLVAQLEQYLQSSENKITELKAKFNTAK